MSDIGVACLGWAVVVVLIGVVLFSLWALVELARDVWDTWRDK